MSRTAGDVGAHELKHIRAMVGGESNTTLWGLLIDIMQRDTEKHIRILQFANKQAKRRKKK